jgi:hypothetical protein
VSKRKRLAAVLVTVATGAVAVAVLWPWPRVSRAKYDRIKLGMSRAQIDTLLGGPGDFTTRATCVSASAEPAWEGAPEAWLGAATEAWRGDEGTIWVAFDASGRVAAKRFQPGERCEPSRLEKFLRRLRYGVVRE